MIEGKQEQPENSLLLIEVRELGRVIEVKLEQHLNAPSPIEVRELGRVIEVKLEQSQNARLPIDVTERGRVIEVKLDIAKLNDNNEELYCNEFERSLAPSVPILFPEWKIY